MQFMGAIHFNTTGPYSNKKKSRNIHQQKTLTITLNPNPRFYQVKLENMVKMFYA